MALLGGIQRCDLPGQVVIPRPGAELVKAHRHNPLRRIGSTWRSGRWGYLPVMQKVYGTSDLESVREVRGTGSEQSAVTAQLVIDGLGLRRIQSDEGSVMSQQSVRQEHSGRPWMPRPCCDGPTGNAGWGVGGRGIDRTR